MRDRVNITFVTPMDGAFTKPKAARALEHLLTEKNINIISDFALSVLTTKTGRLSTTPARKLLSIYW
jgi:sulfide:quinone oxidoreductase